MPAESKSANVQLKVAVITSLCALLVVLCPILIEKCGTKPAIKPPDAVVEVKDLRTMYELSIKPVVNQISESVERLASRVARLEMEISTNQGSGESETECPACPSCVCPKTAPGAETIAVRVHRMSPSHNRSKPSPKPAPKPKRAMKRPAPKPRRALAPKPPQRKMPKLPGFDQMMLRK